jgi:hypothetical protein
VTRRIIVTLTGTGGWEASVTDALPRVLSAANSSFGPMPIPPDGANLPVDELAAALGRLDRNAVSEGDAKSIGRHLLACLVDDATWSAWRDGGEDMHLVVTTADGAGPLQRLPWELLHDGDRFLATRRGPAVTISRAVGTADVPTQRVKIKPVVLVVIGGALEEPALQPAAEYLALLDALRRGKLALDAHLIVNANRDDVKAACADLEPDVVHIIAHGDQMADGTGFLELAPSKKGDKQRERVGAEQLVTLLEAGGRLPQVLVLTACRTAASQLAAAQPPTGAAGNLGPDDAPVTEVFTFRPSLAAACVALGVPVVAAMTGAIASRACREFTLGFYGALFTGGDVVTAADAGRREAFVGADAPTRAVDWAYPAVFCGPGVDGTVEVTAGAARAARVARARELLGRFRKPPAFCGRHDVLDAFGRLLALANPSAPAVLALRVPNDVATTIKVGTSRALAQLGAGAMLAGHAVADSGLVAGDDRALTFQKLAGRLIYRSDIAARAYGAEPPTYYQVRLLLTPEHAALDPLLRNLVQIAGAAPDSDEATALALQLDLTAIERAIRGAPEPGRGLVVIVDDLHAYGPAVRPLLVRAVSTNGLGTAAGRVPLVFSYAEIDDTSGAGAIEAIREFVQTGRTVNVDMKPFTPPGAWLAYQQLLLGAEVPLVPIAERRETILSQMHEVSQGNPDKFAKEALCSTIAAFRVMDALVPATDIERLAQLTGQAP